MCPSSLSSMHYLHFCQLGFLQTVSILLPGRCQSTQSPLYRLLLLQVSPVRPRCSWCDRSCHPYCCAHVHLHQIDQQPRLMHDHQSTQVCHHCLLSHTVPQHQRGCQPWTWCAHPCPTHQRQTHPDKQQAICVAIKHIWVTNALAQPVCASFFATMATCCT